MKIRPVILCGGSGTRLWVKNKNNLAKQFINFGGWTLFEKTLLRIKNPIFEYPIITTNILYLKLVKVYLKKHKFSKYIIILEPLKKNTAAAIAASIISPEILVGEPMIFFPSDHLIENNEKFYKSLKLNLKYLNNQDIFVFGIKPTTSSSQYGYFLTNNKSKGKNKVSKFIEKPTSLRAKKIIQKGGYWNSGIVFALKSAVWDHFEKYDSKTLNFCIKSFIKRKNLRKKVISLNKKEFNKIKEKSFDYAVLEKSEYINGIKIDVPWSDLGSWKEISKIFNKNKKKYFKAKNVFYRPWGSYTNLFYGKNFLIKELTIKAKSSISLQKHNHRSEHWMITEGNPKITINKKSFFKKVNDSVYVKKGSVHRIENLFEKPVKIIEVQIGSILKETDIIRYKDVYGRIK